MFNIRLSELIKIKNIINNYQTKNLSVLIS